MTRQNRHLTQLRRRKDDVRPKVAQLAREGYAVREIAHRLRLSKSTVHNWLNEDLRSMTDAELAALDAHLASGNEPRSSGVRLPPLSDEELSAMTDEQLEAMDIELRRMISQAAEPPAASGSENRGRAEEQALGGIPLP